MRDIVSDILTWPWFSEPHGYSFNGHLACDPDGNICIDPVAPYGVRVEGNGIQIAKP